MKLNRLVRAGALGAALACSGIAVANPALAAGTDAAHQAGSAFAKARASVSAGTASDLGVIAEIGVGANPWGVAFTPNGMFALSVDSGAGTVSKINARDRSTSTIPVGRTPYNVAVSPDGSYAYVPNNGSDSVTRINLADDTTTTIALAPGAAPIGIAISPDGSYAYVTNNGTNSVTRINLADNTTTSIPVGVSPRGVAISKDGSFAYVANTGTADLTRIDTRNDTTTSIPVGVTDLSGVAISPDGSFAYVTHAGLNVMTRINSDGSPASNVVVGADAHSVAFSPDGSVAYVAARGSNVVTAVSSADGSTTLIPVSGPTGVAFSPDGSFAYATEYLAGKVAVIARGVAEVTDVRVDHSTTPPTLHGIGSPGAGVSVKDTSGGMLGTATVSQDGSWTIALSGPPRSDGLVDVVQTVAGVESAPHRVDVSRVVAAPVFVSVDTATAPPTLHGTGEKGATVQAEDSKGNSIGQVAVDSSGNWTLHLSGWPQSDGKVRLTQTIGGSTSEAATATIPVVIPALPVPTVDLKSTPPLMTGTGAEPGATIVVTDSNGNKVAETTAALDGRWSVELPKGIDPKTSMQIVQVVNGTDSLPTEFTLVDAPAVDLGVATASLASAGAGVAGLLLLRRRRVSGQTAASDRT
jgi:YVTN family beta-propeller protein